MKKIVIAPDSFKGTLSAREVAEIVSSAAHDAISDVQTVLIPIADGGEGTVDAFGAEHIKCVVTGPNQNRADSYYGILPDGTAVIEMAAAAGLPMANPLSAKATTTFGVGELIMNALDNGVTNFIVGLGGSATNDCGCGMAAACGVSFFDQKGNKFIPVGESLSKIAHIDISTRDKRISNCTFTAMCDIDNPLFGKNGAAYVFAPQKGATPEDVQMLDEGLKHISDIIKKDIGVDISNLSGAGAAGGCGAAVTAFFGGKLKRGIDVVLDQNNFNALLDNADMVVTGEGKFDSQTAGGKAISGIAARTKAKNIPLVVLCGAAEEDESAYEMGVTSVFSIQRKAQPFEIAKGLNAPYLYRTAYNMFKLFNI